MATLRYVLSVLLLGVCTFAEARIPRLDKASPLFLGNKIPDPPQQHLAWRAPTKKVPDNLIKLNEEIFKLGFADPRGCEYRVITVALGTVWTGDAGTFQTHGWVLPADAKSSHRFAICWNALVYPVLQVGAPANLAADVKSAAKARRDKKDQYTQDEYPPSSEGWSIWHRNLGARHPLLLRLGEIDLFLEDFGGEHEKEASLNESFVSWGSEWCWTLFERSICAQMRGDDVLALHGYRMLEKARPLIEARLPKVDKKEDARERGPLDFLGQLSALRANQERRVQKPRQYADIVCVGQGKNPDAQKRIAALVERLDEVSARQQGQPGGVSIGSDPIVQALIREGEPAIGPLIDCLEKDERFTRSVHFWRDFARSRTVLSVQEAAYTALTAILQTGGFEPAATGDNLTNREPGTRKELADHFRKYKKKLGNISNAERYFRVLADDKAKPEAWADAAAMLVEREDTAYASGTMVWSSATVQTKPKSNKIVGESLRSKSEPSLTELLAKRIGQCKNVSMSAHLALALAKWEPKAGVRSLKKVTQDRDLADKDPNLFVSMLDARISAGEDSALDDYAKWLRGVRPTVLRQTWYGNIFWPMINHANHPGISASAEWLFNDSKSPWLPLMGNKSGDSDSSVSSFQTASATSQIFETFMVRHPQVRRAFLRELANKKQIGNTEYDKTGRRSYNLPDITNSWEASEPWRDIQLPPEGAKGPIRVCDWVAWQISQTWDGAPRHELWWPEDKRDKAIVACKSFLEKYGERLGREYQQLTFPVRDRPATAEEVRNGEAIFSLQGKVRSLPWKLPVEAQWTTLKDNAYHVKEKKNGKTVSNLTYWNKGRIWQAEEVFEDGKWRRYFGFCGSHRIERVPAEEIEFLPPTGSWWVQPKEIWTELAPGIHARLRGWWQADDLYEGGFARRAPGQPLPLIVEFWNSRGHDQPMPDPREILKLRVSYSPEKISRQGFLAPVNEWRAVTPRGAIAWKNLPTTLPSGQIVALAAIDMRQWIDLESNGFYQVSLGTINLQFSQGTP